MKNTLIPLGLRESKHMRAYTCTHACMHARAHTYTHMRTHRTCSVPWQKAAQFVRVVKGGSMSSSKNPEIPLSTGTHAARAMWMGIDTSPNPEA